jgi:hypothetical protein
MAEMATTSQIDAVTANGIAAHSRSSSVVTRALRPTDAFSWRQLQLLTALMDWPEARHRFLELGVGPEIFGDPDLVRVAASCINGGGAFSSNAQCALDLPRDKHRTLRESLSVYRQSKSEWAVRDVERHLAHFARAWMPAHLRWFAEQLESGGSFEHCVHEITKLIRLGSNR